MAIRKKANPQRRQPTRKGGRSIPSGRGASPPLKKLANSNSRNNKQDSSSLDTRERIVNAATRVLLKEGVEGFSMRKLALQIGYTPTAIYFHFRDKQSLLGEVVDRQFMVFRQAFEKITQTPDPIERLRQMGGAFVDFARKHPDHYQLLFLKQLHTIPRGRLIEKGNPRQDCYALLLATVREAIEVGRLRADLNEPHLVAQVFFAGVHGLMALHVIKGQDDWVQWAPVEKKAPVLIDALISGITATDTGFRLSQNVTVRDRGRSTPRKRGGR